MNRKKLISLLLAVFMVAALLPVSAFAGEIPSAVAETSGRWQIRVRFTCGQTDDLSPVTVKNERGRVIPPYVDENGTPLYGCYLLAPGTYSYSFHDAAGKFADLTETTLVLGENDNYKEIPLTLTARTGERADDRDEQDDGDAQDDRSGQNAQKMPVIFRFRDAGDFSGLRIFDAGGRLQSPYIDPDTGEVQYANYLLLPGRYTYTYHDPQGRNADGQGSFTVEARGVQVITLTPGQETEQTGFTCAVVNPVYAYVVPASALPQPSLGPEESLAQLRLALSALAEAASSQSRYSITVYDNVDNAGAALKRGLLQRQREITVRFGCNVEPSEEAWSFLSEKIFNAAIRHTGASAEGDGLRFDEGGFRCVGAAALLEGTDIYVYEFNYAPLYFTSAAQENDLNGRVSNLLSALELAGKSDEQKISAIYKLLCDNVKCEDIPDAMTFTAYNALMRGRASSQGIAAAFYRLCLSAGVDARVVSSAGMRHAWNIVCVDGTRYYALDAAWDAGRTPDNWQYFLRGRTSWQEEHSLGDEFTEGSYSGYTFPAEDYGSKSYVIIESVSLLFDGMLRIKYYFTIPEQLMGSRDACIQFSRDGEIIQSTPLTSARIEGSSCCFYCGVSAENIGSSVQVRIKDADGQPVEIRTKDGTVYPNGFFFSAMDYARQKKTSASNAAMRNLAQALEDYGTAAQIYFKKTGGSVSGAVKAVSAADLAAWTVKADGTKPAGLASASISSVFEADNSLRVYFKFEAGRDPGGYTYTVDGKSSLLHMRDDGAVYLNVANIAADDLHTAHRFTVSDGTHTFTVTASVLSYAKITIEQGNEAIADLGRALYLYNRTARAYFGT